MKLSEEFINRLSEGALQRFIPFFNSFHHELEKQGIDNEARISVNQELLLYIQDYLNFNEKAVLEGKDIERLLEELGSPELLAYELTYPIECKKFRCRYQVAPFLERCPACQTLVRSTGYKGSSFDSKFLKWAKRYYILTSIVLGLCSGLVSYYVIKRDLIGVVILLLVLLIPFVFYRSKPRVRDTITKEINWFESKVILFTFFPFWIFSMGFRNHYLGIFFIISSIYTFLFLWYYILRNYSSPNLFTYLIIRRKITARGNLWEQRYGTKKRLLFITISFISILALLTLLFQIEGHLAFLILILVIPTILYSAGQTFIFFPVFTDFYFKKKSR